MCEEKKDHGAGFCFNCGGPLVWDNDFSYEDYGLIGEGIVHALHCTECGAETLCYVPMDDDADTV